MISTSLPIAFSSVLLEVYGSTNTSGKTLMNTFTEALGGLGTFNGTYAATGSRLLEFRGYKDPPRTGSIGATGSTSSTIDTVFNMFDNVAVTSQVLWYKTTSGGSWVSIVVGANDTTYTLTGLQSSTSYSFYVVACDGVGNCTTAPTQNVSTLAPTGDTTSPVFTSNGFTNGVHLSDEGPDWLLCHWKVSDNVGVTAQRVYYRVTGGAWSFKQENNLTPDGSGLYNYILDGLSSSTSYEVYVIAYDAAGNSTASSSYTRSTSAGAGDTTPPTFTSNALSLTGKTETSISLSWVAATDNVGVTGYKVWKRLSTTGTFSLHTTLSSATTSYTVSGLASDTQYVFYVQATDAAGNTGALAETNTVTDTTNSPPMPFAISPTYYSSPFGTIIFSITISNTTGGWTSNDSSVWISRSPVSNGSDSSTSITLQENPESFSRSGWVDITSNGVTIRCNIDQDAGSGGCLIENTEITYFDGSMRLIQDLVVGDEILSPAIIGFNDTNNVIELYESTIKNMSFDNIKAKIIKIEPIERDMVVQLNNGLLSASKEHSQLIKRGDSYIFRPLDQVLLGDYLVDFAGHEVLITEIKKIVDNQTVYKLTLEGPTHTFYANGIITHNVKGL